ncbi:unnamed protein product, partial [Brenthis ino]
MFVINLCQRQNVRINRQGCNFYPAGEYLKFVRIPENLSVGDEVLQVEVHPRKNLILQAVDREEDAHLFTYRDVNRTHVAVILAQSVDDLVDNDSPQNIVKFRLGCDFDTGDDLISAFLSVTVYIEDINDNVPIFLDTPYRISVDELTPPGLTIFKGIRAFDRDKPNTPNSEIQYSITSGDERFILESSHKPALILNKPLDFDSGDREFVLVVTASDRGSPPRSSNTTVHILVQDNDDLPPKFTHDVYRTKIPEFYPILGKRIHKELTFEPPIRAFDQDAGVAAPVRYALAAGDARGTFRLSALNGSLFLEREIDLDAETSLPGNTFVLQIQASQVDNPLKTAQARVEVEVLDLNDNLPNFEVDFYNISIVENLPNGFSVLQVMAADRDQGDNAAFSYELRDASGAFAVDARSGWLTVRDQTVLDREQHSSLRMKVYAKEKIPSVISTFTDNRLTKWRRPHKEKTTYIFPDKSASNENIEIVDTNQIMSFVTVEVTLLDANDNNPVFIPSNLYEFTVRYDTPINSEIGKVEAVDPDLGRNGLVLYDLQRTSNLTVTSPFAIEAKTGIVRVVESPLLEGRYALFVEAADSPLNPSERRYSLAVVTIDVVGDSKVDTPSFLGAPYEFWVGASAGVGASVGQLRLRAAAAAGVTYDLLHSYEEGVPFAVEERSGVITVIDELSKFDRPLYDFEAVAIIENRNMTITTNATVHVVDVNDERGVFLKGTHSPFVFHVKENLAGATIGHIFPVNGSSFSNNSGNIKFIIANQQDVANEITIGPDGTIYTQKALDREKRDMYRMTVIAEFNKGVISGAGLYQITVHVDDDNDNPPIFDMPVYEGFITENSKTGTEVKMTHRIQANDADLDQNAVFMYTLFGDGHDQFNVNEETGVVTYIGNKLDREEKSVYLLKIVARDKGSLKSEAKLTITILDENDNHPKFNQILIPFGEPIELLEVDENTSINIYSEKMNNSTGAVLKVEAKPKDKFAATNSPLFLVPESIAIGTTILKLEAIDMDTGVNGQVRYEFVSEIFMPPYAGLASASQVKRYFVINERYGHIVVARALPPESEFRLNISALDGGELSDFITIRLFIKDVNDHFPMFKKSWYNFNVEEAQYSRRVLGKVDATDADFGQNANLTYFLQPSSKDIPFEISPLNGVLSVNGVLDREKEDKYTLTVVARDNGFEKKLSSSVSVEIQVLDVNDNAPKFFAYDELLEWKHPEAHELSNHNFDSVMMLPVYKAVLEENTPIGTVVTRVYANDSDFIGNGNGLILYSLPQRKNQLNIFSIDSKEGIITTTTRLDYESQKIHNITVVASDLGSPSLSSTAIVMLTVKDIPDDVEVSDKPVFISRYYELEIEENVRTPVELVTLNLTEYYENFKMKYYILNENDTDIKKTFVIDPRNGTLYLIKSPDREVRELYEITVRAERQKISRELPHMIYPVPDDVFEGMTKFDVKVVVRIKDVNDNAPKFVTGGRPVVTAIPTNAPFGYEVIQLQATDADAGLNADIRYSLVSAGGAPFSVDARSGTVRLAGAAGGAGAGAGAGGAGQVLGFDVKATDRAGADDGRSAIVNVFTKESKKYIFCIVGKCIYAPTVHSAVREVPEAARTAMSRPCPQVYVLAESQQLVVSLRGAARAAAARRAALRAALAAAAALDVRVRRLQPGAAPDQTDLYIYAVDPVSNSIVDMEVLHKALLKQEGFLRGELAGFPVLGVGGARAAPARRALGSMELSVVALGCLVFVGACAAAFCILCVRKTRRNRHKPFSQQRLTAFSTDLTKFGGLFPSGNNQCQELNHSFSEDSYIDVVNQTMKKTCPHTAVEEFGKVHQKCVKGQFADINGKEKHERLCIKFNQRPMQKRKDPSLTSVTSSGRDSGIERCACGRADMHAEESSGCSYEDSLKSNHQIRKPRTDQRFIRRASFNHQSLDPRKYSHRRQSFSENIQKHFPFERIGSVPHIPSNSYFLRKSRNDVSEPVIDYEHSEIDDVFDTRVRDRAGFTGKERDRMVFSRPL